MAGFIPFFHAANAAAHFATAVSIISGPLLQANIIVAERAREEAPIGFGDYFRVGLPVTVLTLFLGWLWLRWIA